jgi:hypothetical protein
MQSVGIEGIATDNRKDSAPSWRNRLSNSLDTVSQLEIGLHSYVTELRHDLDGARPWLHPSALQK